MRWEEWRNERKSREGGICWSQPCLGGFPEDRLFDSAVMRSDGSWRWFLVWMGRSGFQNLDCESTALNSLISVKYFGWKVSAINFFFSFQGVRLCVLLSNPNVYTSQVFYLTYLIFMCCCQVFLTESHPCNGITVWKHRLNHPLFLIER